MYLHTSTGSHKCDSKKNDHYTIIISFYVRLPCIPGKNLILRNVSEILENKKSKSRLFLFLCADCTHPVDNILCASEHRTPSVDPQRLSILTFLINEGYSLHDAKWALEQTNDPDIALSILQSLGTNTKQIGLEENICYCDYR